MSELHVTIHPNGEVMSTGTTPAPAAPAISLTSLFPWLVIIGLVAYLHFYVMPRLSAPAVGPAPPAADIVAVQSAFTAHRSHEGQRLREVAAQVRAGSVKSDKNSIFQALQAARLAEATAVVNAVDAATDKPAALEACAAIADKGSKK